jgi:LysM repeat protein
MVRRAVMYVVSILLIATALAGCTLAGSSAAPLTPVVPDTGTSEPQGQVTQTIPTPTEVLAIDLFGTQTAMAPAATLPPSEEVITPGATEGTPGGETTPGATAEPTQPPALTPVPPTQEPTPGECPATHTVQEGENLFRIGLRYGLTYQELATANGITNSAAISIGQVLVIPGCSGAGTGDTGAGDGDILHTVQTGENLFRIALRYGLTYQELASYNNITNPNALVPGQVIRIPSD